MKKSAAATSARSGKTELKNVHFWAVDFYKDAVAVLSSGRRGGKAAPLGGQGSVLKMPAFWLGLLVCCQLGAQLYVRYQRSIADDRLYDAVDSEAELPKLLAESQLAGSSCDSARPGAATSNIVKSVGELRRMGRPLTSDQVQEVVPTPQAPPSTASKPGVPRRSVYEELAEATCQMCMQSDRDDYKECAQFRDVHSCGAARRQGLLRDWAENVASHRLGLELGPLVRAELVPPTPDMLLRAFEDIEAKHLEWDSELAAEAAGAKADLCSDPARKAYAACSDVPAVAPTTLAEEVHLARCELCLEPRRREYEECAEFRGFKKSCALSLAAGRRGRSEDRLAEARVSRGAWGAKATTEAEAYLKELCSDPARKSYAPCASLAPTVEEQAAAYLEELCSDPARKGFAVCARVVPSVMEEIANALKEMCSEPHRQGYAECAGVLPTAEEQAVA